MSSQKVAKFSGERRGPVRRVSGTSSPCGDGRSAASGPWTNQAPCPERGGERSCECGPERAELMWPPSSRPLTVSALSCQSTL
eukprot:9427993-Pyramimonas_sp.AAC.1